LIGGENVLASGHEADGATAAAIQSRIDARTALPHSVLPTSSRRLPVSRIKALPAVRVKKEYEQKTLAEVPAMP
jgi:hypothetical protein